MFDPDAGKFVRTPNSDPLQNFRSFHVGALAQQLEMISFTGEDQQFYLHKEVRKHFKEISLPRIHIDLVNINTVLRPT